MNGAHDLGGKHGLGPIAPEPEAEEPVFHHDWERRVFGLTLALGMLGKWNIDESRFARERQHPRTYLGNSYYENWLAGLETLLAEKQLLQRGPGADLRVPTPARARELLAAGSPATRAVGRKPVFRPGERVRVRKLQAPGHTRAPAYVQGACGVIETCRGNHVYPDRHVSGQEVAEPLYSVRFSGAELWGPDSDAVDVLVDLWEPYLARERGDD